VFGAAAIVILLLAARVATRTIAAAG
jgi:hypothetical protein